MTALIHVKGAGENQLTFPLTQAQIDNLSPCMLANPKVGKKNGFELPALYRDEASMYDMAMEVLNAVTLASRAQPVFDVAGFAKYWPSAWGVFDSSQIEAFRVKRMLNAKPVTLAENVEMDQATEFLNVMHKWVIDRGYKLKTHNLPYIDFLGHEFDVSGHIAESNRIAMHKCFEVKSYYGVARPETVLGYQFTLYTNGAPTHGECVSGHTTAAVNSAVELIKLFDLDEAGKIMLLRMAWHVANSRTIAGVHYYMTNYLTMKWVIEELQGLTIESILNA